MHVLISRITIKEIARAQNIQVNKGSLFIKTLEDTIIRKDNGKIIVLTLLRKGRKKIKWVTKEDDRMNNFPFYP